VIDMDLVTADLHSSDELAAGLKRHFGLDAFRPGQRDVIESVLSGRNTIVVMPTGAGKSLCYQLPALLLDGVTVVVSPLISLMQDQVDALEGRGIPATFINSTLSDGERAERQRRLRAGEYKLVYVAPERFRSEAFMQALLDANVALYAIDEAHCISQWGHDFRPDYALLGQVRKRLRPPRTVALTATATPEVQQDIARVLLMKDPQIFVAGFDRPNLFLEVVAVSGDADKRDACLKLCEEGSGVIYCNTRKQAEAIHEHLEDAGVHAVLYHAGLDDDARKRAQDDFMDTPGAVAVATNAFGMGIDKPDIRFVAHAGIPRAIEAYYQEIGRAGRDGAPARAVLLFNHADVFTQERLIRANHPPETLFADTWDALRHAPTYDRGLAALARQVGASEFELSPVLKLFERHGLVTRAGRGEGEYGVTLLPGAAQHHPRNPDARALLSTLTATQPVGSRLTSTLSLLGRRCGLDAEAVRHALNLLERAGALQVQRPFAGRTIEVLRHEPWNELNIDLSALRAQERNQLMLLKRMTDYAYTKRCRRAYLLRYFGEKVPSSRDCGGCDVCSGPRLELSTPKATAPQGPTGARTLPERYSHLAAEELKRWRRELSQDLGVPPFIIFNDATLYALAAALPITREEFLRVKGTGPSRWERFGPQVTKLCLMARAAGDAPQALAPVAPKKRARR
jgi:ATP-dependent DNA helicase RecQ